MRQPCVAFLTCMLVACGSERDFVEVDIATLHDDIQRGELKSEELVNWYLDRIEAIDRSGPTLQSIVEINPDALMIARALDEEWQSSGPRGPLHGIPVVLKANIGTADAMATSAGSLALAEHVPPNDAFVVKRLRDAGAVILGKANLSEWANFRSTRSSSGWSSVGGQTLNPYDTRRSPCGSSSGSAVAVAANLTVVAVGTETDGSIVCPAATTGVVGIKPTLGLVSRSGIVPIAHSQDTAGPMARSVRDAALLLTAMTGIDPDDEAMDGAEIHHNYSAGLTADALEGKRIGVIPFEPGSDMHPDLDAIYRRSVTVLTEGGAIAVENLEIDVGNLYDAEYEVLLYEFKADLNAYLESTQAPLRTLAELIAFNEANAEAVMPHFGQEIFLAADAKGPLTDADYLEALKTSKRIARETIDGLFEKHDLDALISLTGGPAWMIDHINGDAFGYGSSSLAAVAGYPSISVPAGFVENLPIGVSFTGTAWSEKRLIEIAYAFEQTTGVRKPPEL